MALAITMGMALALAMAIPMVMGMQVHVFGLFMAIATVMASLVCRACHVFLHALPMFFYTRFPCKKTYVWNPGGINEWNPGGTNEAQMEPRGDKRNTKWNPGGTNASETEAVGLENVWIQATHA